MFENVHVPVENLIGQENEGFRYIMVNFNHERLMIVFGSLRLLRNLIGESLRHAHRRKTFGKALIEHAVIRAKLANMIRETEACQALVDQLIYNFDTLPRRQNLM
jgi:alkylation response protein AidB-like acyl-CoA dehydrogenase